MRVTPKQKQLEKAVVDAKAAVAKYEAEHPGIRQQIADLEAARDEASKRLDVARREVHAAARLAAHDGRVRTAKGDWHPDFIAAVEKAIGLPFERGDELSRRSYGANPMVEAMSKLEARYVDAHPEVKAAKATNNKAYELYRDLSDRHYALARHLNYADDKVKKAERELADYLAERQAAEENKADTSYQEAMKREEERKAVLRVARAWAEAIAEGKLKVEW